jgi:peptidoglycan hydrolase CwlO-like protein
MKKIKITTKITKGKITSSDHNPVRVGDDITIVSKKKTTTEDPIVIGDPLPPVRPTLRELVMSVIKEQQVQGKQIQEQGKQIQEHGKQIQELSKQIQEHGKQIQEHGKHIQSIRIEVQKQGKRLDVIEGDIKLLKKNVFKK